MKNRLRFLFWHDGKDPANTTTIAFMGHFLPQSERKVWKPYLILAILQVLDIATTVFLLHHYGNGAEGNPIAKAIIDLGWVGFPAVLVLKLYAIYMMYGYQSKAKIAAALYGAVILNNLIWIYPHFFG